MEENNNNNINNEQNNNINENNKNSNSNAKNVLDNVTKLNINSLDNLSSTDRKSNNNDINQKPTKKKHKHKKHKKKKDEKDENNKSSRKNVKRSVFSNEQFIINGNYNLIKMIGFGAFGEIHLAYDSNSKQLRAIKFELTNFKNPQLKHEYAILETLNTIENNKSNSHNNSINYDNLKTKNGGIIGIPKVYLFDRMENKYNYMIMDFLGPSIGDLYQLKNKKFSLETLLMLMIQLLTRIEYIHEKGFIHRDVKPENFVIGLNESSNIIHVIDFGLSRRFKDKITGQHIPYKENRHMIGTVRYASINSLLGIEQSRRDDIEALGYVITYFFYGSLPWQSNKDKGKAEQFKILEKKLITPPEILCKKMPKQFMIFFNYVRKLKFEDRPDYSMMRNIFAMLLFSRTKVGMKFCFDWFKQEDVVVTRDEDKKEEDNYDNNSENDENKGNKLIDNENNDEDNNDNIDNENNDNNNEDENEEEDVEFNKENFGNINNEYETPIGRNNNVAGENKNFNVINNMNNPATSLKFDQIVKEKENNINPIGVITKNNDDDEEEEEESKSSESEQSGEEEKNNKNNEDKINNNDKNKDNNNNKNEELINNKNEENNNNNEEEKNNNNNEDKNNNNNEEKNNNNDKKSSSDSFGVLKNSSSDEKKKE